MGDNLSRTETITLRITKFEADLIAEAAEKIRRPSDDRDKLKSTALRRGLLYGAYHMIGAMRVAKLREKHLISHDDMVRLFQTDRPDGGFQGGPKILDQVAAAPGMDGPPPDAQDDDSDIGY